MRRVLMVVYHFPPLGGIASLRVLRFARYLPAFGWEPWVLAPRRGDYVNDPTLAYPEDRVVRTGSFELSRILRTTVETLTPTRSLSPPPLGGEGRVRGLRGLIRHWIYRPDAQIGWYPFAVAAGRRLLREHRFDAILSSSFPVTAHLVGRRLHRDSGLPWVADFRDLWSDWSEARRASKARLEESLLREATATTTVSPSYAEALRARGSHRVEVLTNGFDPEDFPTTPAPANGVAAYLGTYYPGIQDLPTAIRAIGALAREGSGLRLRFIGDYPSVLRPEVEAAGLGARTDATGFIPHPLAVEALSRSSVLLLGGPTSADTVAMKGNVAAKVFEYLGSRRPILMIGDPDTDVAGMLRPFARARVVGVGRVGEAVDALRELLRAETAPGGSGEAGERPQLDSEREFISRERDDDRLLEPYTSRDLARRLADLLEGVCH
jgi:glycosyltransferase involved in cell wall biosynthesis